MMFWTGLEEGVRIFPVLIWVTIGKICEINKRHIYHLSACPSYTKNTRLPNRGIIVKNAGYKLLFLKPFSAQSCGLKKSDSYII